VTIETKIRARRLEAIDVHQDCIATAAAEQGRRGEVRDTGALSNDLHAVEKWLGRLRQAHGNERNIKCRCCSRGRCPAAVVFVLPRPTTAATVSPLPVSEFDMSGKHDATLLLGLVRGCA